MSAVAAPTKEVRKITPEMWEKAALNLKKAKVQLAINHPFFAQVVFHREITLSDTISTACITPRGKITVGTAFAADLSVQQMVFLLGHEAMHYAMLHSLRRSWRKHRKWNVACDAVINDLLQESGVGEFIEGGVNMKGSAQKTSEKIYDELPDQGGSGKGKGKGQKGQGDGEGDYQPGEGWDDLDDGEGNGQLDDAEIREIEESVKVELAQAAQVAKQQGKLPAGLARLVDEIINPKTPWHVLLERFMTGYVKSDYSFKKPKKSMASYGLYLPSHDVMPQMGPVVVTIDTSGSIGQRELEHFLGHINRILETCRPEKVYVISCDATVHEPVVELTLDDFPITPEMARKQGMGKGGGGTSFVPPFRWVDSNGVEPEVHIYLTDMYGDFPEKRPQYETVWLSISDIDKAPFGSVIKYEMDEEK